MKLNKASRIFVVLALFTMGLFSSCTKDEVLDKYDQIIQSAGDIQLTKNGLLIGQREYGIDHYTGTYTADFSDFSGTETLFGGTSIEREAGDEIQITCKLNVMNGVAQLSFQSGADKPQILLESTGDYTGTIILPPAGNYIVLHGSGLTGSIELEIR